MSSKSIKSRPVTPTRSDPKSPLQQHWRSNVHECAVCIGADGILHLPIGGGSDRGEFAYFEGLRQGRISYVGEGRLEEGDVLLELHGQKVAGFTQRDVVAWLNHCGKSGHPVALYVARGGFLGKDLRQHLNTRFPKNSPDCDLQNTVRDNLYLRTVPCTTRTPRDGEINGVDYTFLSVEDFMILERSGNLLESGIYEGNHYGTPKPLEECPVPRTSSSSSVLPGIHPSSEGKRRRNRSSVEAMTAKITGEPTESKGRHTEKNNISSSEDSKKQPRRKDVSEDEGQLPENWERAFTEDGEPYFIDHNTGTSQWLDPRPKNKKPVSECEEDELPYGWEKIDDPHYGTYYIDHVNKRTQYENPVAQARKISSSSLHNDSPKNSSPGGHWRGEKEQEGERGSLPRHPEGRQRNASAHSKDGGGPPYAGLRGTGYRPPYVFTEHPGELEGTMLRTSLVKSARGFGFTIVGGDDGDVREFLQVKAITPHGPAWLDGKLAVGDVLVHINDECVLGFSHQDVVSLFQSIPPGEMVHVGVCRGYGLPFDPEDPSNEIVLTNGVSSCDHGNGPSGLCGCLLEAPESSARSAKSMPDLTAFQPQQLQRATSGENASSVQDVSRADLLSVEIVKGKGGFGFTIADSVYGQKVKKILDCDRCQYLQEGDVLSEINGRSVRGLAHCEVVQLLKDCPCDRTARIAIHRGLLPPKVTKMKSADDLGVRRSASNNSSHLYPYGSPISDDTYAPAPSSMYRSKTPTADLYSSKEKESILISRPKTPLVDTRHWQKPASTSSEPNGNQQKVNGGQQTVNPEHRPADFSSSWRADHPPALRTAYSAALDKTTVNPSWYTTLGKLRDTYWAENNHGRELNKSMDFGSASRSSDALDCSQYGYSQPKPQSKPTNFNDSYEDSVFLSNQSWSGKSPHENGAEWNSPGYSQGISAHDASYVHTNSVRSNGPYYCNGSGDHNPSYRMNSSGHSPNSSSYDSLQHRKRGASFENENPASVKGEGLYSGGGSVYSQPGSQVLRPYVAGRAPEYVDMVVTLLRQESGFGFRIIGGTEEGSQVAIGHLVPGGAADLDGRIRTGDEIVSVDNQLVLNTSHHRVVQLIGSTATNGKVTLGLRRRVPSVDSAYHTRSMESIYPYDVTITRQDNEGFGFVIISSVSRAGATIGRIIEGSPADRCRQLHVGDRILCVNGTSTLDLHHGETVNLIKESGHAITLTVGQPMDDSSTPTQQGEDQYHAIELRRGTKGFGFSIRGGREFQNMPLFVLRIAEGGPAHTDGKLVVGDQIIEINGKNTKNMTHAQAIELIRQGNDSVRLLVRRGFSPQEGMTKLSLDSDPFDPQMSQEGRLMDDAPDGPLLKGVGAPTRYRKNSTNFDFENLKHSNILQNDNLVSQINRFPQHLPPMLTSNVQVGGSTSDKSQDYYAWNYEQH